MSRKNLLAIPSPKAKTKLLLDFFASGSHYKEFGMSFRFCLTASAILLSSASAFAQSMPGQWVGDLYFVDVVEGSGSKARYKKHFVDEHNNIVDQTDYKLPKDHEFGSWAPIQFWYNEALYTFARKIEEGEDGSWFSKWTYAKWQDNEWHFLGEYKEKPGVRTELRAIPCDNNRLIVVSRNRNLFAGNGQERSPFAVMSILEGRKELSLDSSIYHGIDELKNHMQDPRFFELACNASFVVTGKYATIVNEITGLYWCFSLERAQLVRAGSIFKNIKPEEMIKTIEKGGFTMAVLCVNPEKDGTVLVSASEEAALKGEIGDKWDEVREMMENNPDLSEKEAEKLFLEHQNKIARRNPYIVWYRIYPENGKVEKLGVPPIGGAHEKKGNIANLLSLGTANAWRPMPDGSVSMGDIIRLERKSPKTNKK